MALTTAFINVVLRRETYEGLDVRRRWIARQAFQWRKPSFRFDDHLMATTFFAPRDVRTFCAWLWARTGLVVDRGVSVSEPPTDHEGLKGTRFSPLSMSCGSWMGDWTISQRFLADHTSIPGGRAALSSVVPPSKKTFRVGAGRH